ncbi:MAG: arginine--tRNA ligase, partial [Ginsengibacter sp.]
MSIIKDLQQAAALGLTALYEQIFTESDFQVNQTKPEFEGDYTVVLFSLVKNLKKSPGTIGEELGEHLTKNYPVIFSKYNVIKGFLNLTISEKYLIEFLQQNFNDKNFGRKKLDGKRIMVEYSSPNTNKPLHLGHLRNNFIGWSIAEILKANGNNVIKTCIVNDRGIHI